MAIPEDIKLGFAELARRIEELRTGETVEAPPYILEWLEADYQARKDQTNA